MVMAMKRLRDLEEGAELLLSLSCGAAARVRPSPERVLHRKAKAAEGIFECKTCSRRFPTFQALGGHRTSHNRPRLDRAAAKRDTAHRCAVCGVEFALGQALGGHMRRHKGAAGAGAEGAGEDLGWSGGAEESEMSVAGLEFDDLRGLRRSTSHRQLLQLFV